MFRSYILAIFMKLLSFLAFANCASAYIVRILQMIKIIVIKNKRYNP